MPAPAHVGPIDPAQPVDIEVAGLSNHAVAFSLWWRPPERDAWTALGQGHTGDGTVGGRTFSVATPPRSQVYYWVAASNPARPHSAYHVRLRVTQGDAPLPNGDIELRGTTGANGNDAVEAWIDLL